MVFSLENVAREENFRGAHLRKGRDKMSFKFMRRIVPALALCLAAVAAPGPASAGDSKIVARYDIAFNGLSIGTFRFQSDWTPNGYHLRAGARISLLSGMLFEWNARTESTGRLTGNGPRPERYSFGFEAGDKAGSVRMHFNGASVSRVNIDPPPKSNRIPVQRHHMTGVLDPLSAVIGLSQLRRPNRGAKSCNDELRIFDGKMRYDLTLRYKTTRQVNSAGYDGPAYVCRVKFKAIAGHKPGKEETGFLEDTDGIEVWLIPVKGAGLYVPYHIYLPLPLGSASMTSEEFHLESARAGKLTVIGAS
jgi:hypothetical protein